MRNARLWNGLLGVQHTTIERVDDALDSGLVVVHVRPSRTRRGRCGVCQKRCPGYDQGHGRRRWRALDAGTTRVLLEADAPRVSCREHGIVVAHVPWARHDAGHTVVFDQQVAWLVVAMNKTKVCALMRIAWRTVGAIITRVVADLQGGEDRLDGLRRIGIDEISFRRGHRYLTIVVDHDKRRLVWAAEGRDSATLAGFFAALGPERCARLTHVSADAAPWISKTVAEHAPDAVLCADAFHVVAWATDALDEVRRHVWNSARGAVSRRRAPTATGEAKKLKGARYALWKNPENLTERQTEKLAWIAKTHPMLYRAYLLKEGLRYVFAAKGDAGQQALDRWLGWAARCRIPSFVALGRRIRKHRAAINAALEHDLSNALIESTNTKIRLITRMAYGFANPAALIALAMLTLGGYQLTLPGRN